MTRAPVVAGVERRVNDPDDISFQFGQIREVLQRLAEHMRSIDDSGQQQDFIVKQLAPILQGTRTDIVEMRATLLRLALAIELAVSQMPIEEETPAEHVEGDERRKAERRKG